MTVQTCFERFRWINNLSAMLPNSGGIRIFAYKDALKPALLNIQYHKHRELFLSNPNLEQARE